jgi:hypothetical protein
MRDDYHTDTATRIQGVADKRIKIGGGVRPKGIHHCCNTAERMVVKEIRWKPQVSIKK